MARTFYWFDYETFGKDKWRDRPAQFGGIRTDENLNLIGKPDLFYCQPADDYLPSPEASMVTGITPLTMLDDGLSEAEFAQTVHDKLTVPETISVGYNNINFDDEITRFMFWRNLIDPYCVSKVPGVARLDLFGLIRAVYAFHPEILQWMQKEDGTFSLKLEHLSQANGIVHKHAHDALSDAEATLGLARLIQQRCPKLWAYALTTIDAKKNEERLRAQKPLIYINPYAGQAKSYLSVIYPFMVNPDNPNEWLCWDLAYEPEELLNISAEDMKTRSFLKREQIEAGIKPLPIIRIRKNKQPFLIEGLGFLTPDRQQQLGVTKTQVKERAARLSQMDVRFFNGICAEMAEQRSEQMNRKSAEIETGLYSGGFLSRGDRAKLDHIRQMSPEELVGHSEDFDREELDDLVFRYRARNYPETLQTAKEAKRWFKYKSERFFSGRDGARTFDEYFTLIDQLRAEYPDKADILDELQEYGENLQVDFDLGE